MNQSVRLMIVGILGAITVALGALGAHWLKNQLPGGLITADQINGFDTGVKYQMYHTLAMFLVLLYALQAPHKFLKHAYNCFLTGIILFSGSLYLLCTHNLFQAPFLKVLGPVTPIGGLFFIAGWLFFAFSAFKKPQP